MVKMNHTKRRKTLKANESLRKSKTLKISESDLVSYTSRWSESTHKSITSPCSGLTKLHKWYNNKKCVIYYKKYTIVWSGIKIKAG